MGLVKWKGEVNYGEGGLSTRGWGLVSLGRLFVDLVSECVDNERVSLKLEAWMRNWGGDSGNRGFIGKIEIEDGSSKIDANTFLGTVMFKIIRANIDGIRVDINLNGKRAIVEGTGWVEPDFEFFSEMKHANWSNWREKCCVPGQCCR
jgi:hypothetical protein